MTDNSLRPTPYTPHPKLRVAQVITRMDWGGSPDIVRVLCAGLNPEEFEVTLVCGPSRHLSEKTKKFFAEFKNIRIVSCLRRDINPILDFCAFWQLYFVFLAGRFDIVHTHTAKAGFLGRIAARIAGVRQIVHTSHGHNFYGYFGKLFSALIVLLERFAGLCTDCLLTLTRTEEEDFKKYRILDPKKIKRIDTVVETKTYQPLNDNEKALKRKELGLSQESILVGMVARLEPIKGGELFLKSAFIVSEEFRNIQFIVVGDGSLQAQLKKLADDEPRAKGKIMFLGWKDNPLDYISAMNILVLPSLNEAVGLVLLEAQSLGVPVIATQVGGVPDVVIHNRTGILVPSQSVRAMSDAMRELVSNGMRRKMMEKAGVEFVRGRFTPDIFCRNLSQIYRELTRGANK